MSFWKPRVGVSFSVPDNNKPRCVCIVYALPPGATPQPNRQVSEDTLTLNGVTALNNGVYQCNVSNQYGYLLANAFVNVLRKSPLSSKSCFCSAVGNLITINTCNNKSARRATSHVDGIFPTTVNSVSLDATPRILGPRNELIKVTEGSHTFADCRYFGSPVPELRW